MAVRLHRPLKPTFGIPEWLGAVGVPLLLVARFVPLARLPFWFCALRRLTGIPCPSCGMTRSLDWFAQGRLLDALLVNPIGFGLAASSALGLVYLIAYPLRLPRLAIDLTPTGARAARIGIAASLALNWAYLIARTVWMRP